MCYFLKYLFHFINKAKKYKSNTGTTYPSGAHEFTTGFQWGSCCSLYNVCGSSIYASDYFFGIFKLSIANLFTVFGLLASKDFLIWISDEGH